MVKVTMGKQKLYITGIYRSPSEDLDKVLNIHSETLERSKAENHDLLIIYDNNVSSLLQDTNTKKLSEILNTHNLTRLSSTH